LDDPEPYLNLILLLGLLKPISIGVLISFLILIILLLFSAFISGSEVAFFSLTPNEKEVLNSNSNKRYNIIKKLLESPKTLLATILISNNFINVAIIILSTSIINNIFDFTAISLWLNFSIQVVGITFIILLFGEVIPKIYATKHALNLAKIMAHPLSLLKKLFKPISYLLISSTGIIGKRVKRKGLDVSVEELSHALELTEDIPENNDEHRILKGIVKFGETSVKQVMKARVECSINREKHQF